MINLDHLISLDIIVFLFNLDINANPEYLLVTIYILHALYINLLK